jgi:hypothetical protein
MGLSEFIEKNEKQYGSKVAQVEWEKGKRLMGALSSTGAVQLLERLEQSILSNPVLRDGQERLIGLHKVLFVTGQSEVKHIAILDNKENEFEIQDLNSPYAEKNSGITYPTAFLIFQYNFNTWKVDRGSYFTGSKLEDRRSCLAIVLGCSDPEEIGGMIASMKDTSLFPSGYSSQAIKFKTRDLRMTGHMDDFLGKLYVPATPKKDLPWH